MLIYWGTQGVRPLKIEADRTEVAINEPFTITVKYLNNTDGDWIQLEGATVHVNDEYITDSEGKATITLTESKVYDVYTEKWGNTPEDQFIRRDLIKVGVGVPIPEFNTAIQFLIGIIIALSLILTKRRSPNRNPQRGLKACVCCICCLALRLDTSTRNNNQPFLTFFQN